MINFLRRTKYYYISYHYTDTNNPEIGGFGVYFEITKIPPTYQTIYNDCTEMYGGSVDLIIMNIQKLSSDEYDAIVTNQILMQQQ